LYATSSASARAYINSSALGGRATSEVAAGNATNSEAEKSSQTSVDNSSARPKGKTKKKKSSLVKSDQHWDAWWRKYFTRYREPRETPEGDIADAPDDDGDKGIKQKLSKQTRVIESAVGGKASFEGIHADTAEEKANEEENTDDKSGKKAGKKERKAVVKPHSMDLSSSQHDGSIVSTPAHHRATKRVSSAKPSVTRSKKQSVVGKASVEGIHIDTAEEKLKKGETTYRKFSDNAADKEKTAEKMAKKGAKTDKQSSDDAGQQEQKAEKKAANGAKTDKQSSDDGGNQEETSEEKEKSAFDEESRPDPKSQISHSYDASPLPRDFRISAPVKSAEQPIEIVLSEQESSEEAEPSSAIKVEVKPSAEIELSPTASAETEDPWVDVNK